MVNGGGWVGGDKWDYGTREPSAYPTPPPRPASRVTVNAICCPTCSSLHVVIRTSRGDEHRFECVDCTGKWREIVALTIVRALTVL